MNKINRCADRYAEVYLDISVLKIDHPFDYKIPPHLVNHAKVGNIVLVPFKSRLEIGYIVNVKNKSSLLEKEIKCIEKVISSRPLFDENRLKLIQWMSCYYIQPVNRVFNLFLPPGGKYKLEKTWKFDTAKLKKLAGDYPELGCIKQDEAISESELIKKMSASRRICEEDIKKMLKLLEKEGIASHSYDISSENVKLKYRDLIELNLDGYRKIKNKINWNKNFSQKRIIDYLIKNRRAPRSELVKNAGCSLSSLKALIDKEILAVKSERVKRDFSYDFLYTEDKLKSKKIILNTYQKKCLENINSSIDKNVFHGFLIEGVAGSGKTEVYIEVCRKILGKNRRALVLTPEISLTPQLFSRFKSVFGPGVAVYHSGMGKAERYERWLNILENKYSIIIGTRSSLFTPINNLGAIIIDEEHDPSYKENSLVRYNTQDVALKLGKILKIPVVFGSATPSMVTRFNAERDDSFTLLKIPVKAQSMISVDKEVIDLRSIDKFKEDLDITNELFKAIRKEVEKNNKIIIFINRRGYSNFIVCSDCGYIPECSNCSLSYKFHKYGRKLVCHHCGKEEKYTGRCAACGSKNVFLYGTGIQRVEAKLNLRFKNTEILRMDSDVTSKKKSHEEILKKFISASPSILIGTQMVAKGLDIEDVTLVGIINCDSMLALPDYHMYERVYQLITQVSGRTGRKSKKGKVIIQTYNPESSIIKNFMDGDYNSFYEAELKNRRELMYPPFSNLVNIIISGKSKDAVESDAKKLFKNVNKIIGACDIILGPVAAPFYKINQFYRWHFLIKTTEIYKLNVKLSSVLKGFKKYNKNKIIVDIDPAWML